MQVEGAFRPKKLNDMNEKKKRFSQNISGNEQNVASFLHLEIKSGRQRDG